MCNDCWGTCIWFEEHGRDKIHIDDAGRFAKHAGNTKIFKCVETNGDYITIVYGSESFRVKKELFKIVPTPKYDFGAIVTLSKDSSTKGVITDIMWHSNNQAHYYFISVNGKKKSKRYYDSEFMEKE